MAHMDKVLELYCPNQGDSLVMGKICYFFMKFPYIFNEVVYLHRFLLFRKEKKCTKKPALLAF